MQREILVILENKPGALARIVGLFHQRGYNIESLHVDPVTDIENYKEPLLQTKAQPTMSTSDSQEYSEFNHSQMRKVIAKRLSESKFSAPHYYLNVELDMSETIAFRKQCNTIPY